MTGLRGVFGYFNLSNIAIGFDVELPSATGDNQFAIGSGTNRWIYGDSSYNIYDKDGNQLNGAGGGGGIASVAADTTPQLGGDLDLNSSDITGTGNISITGTVVGDSVASSANGMRKITASTSSPSGGSDGDIWIKYTA